MSQGNVELARQSVDAVNRRDLDRILSLMDSDVHAVSRLSAIEGGDRGHEGIRYWWDMFLDTWPDFSAGIVELHAVGDVTLAELQLRGRGAGSEIPSVWTVYNAARWRRGKCVWWGNFATHAAALEAVGLSEQDVHAESP
jgi:ketosteroid isomerase-like protein